MRVKLCGELLIASCYSCSLINSIYIYSIVYIIHGLIPYESMSLTSFAAGGLAMHHQQLWTPWRLTTAVDSISGSPREVQPHLRWLQQALRDLLRGYRSGVGSSQTHGTSRGVAKLVVWYGLCSDEMWLREMDLASNLWIGHDLITFFSFYVDVINLMTCCWIWFILRNPKRRIAGYFQESDHAAPSKAWGTLPGSQPVSNLLVGH